MAVGDSGVGKSTVCKLLIDLLYSQGKTVKAYNHDNFQKLQAYSNLITVERLDFFRSEIDQVLEDFTNQQLDVIIVDMPGKCIDKICNLISKSQMFKLSADLNWKITFIQPITHKLDCLQYMESLLEFSKHQADYIVVKNQHFDNRFKNYQSNMQDKLYLVGGVDLSLTKLHTDHYEAMERANKPYSQIRNEKSIYIVYRSYIYRWIQNFNQLILNNPVASNYLGLTIADF
ncbi:ATP-binding protein [Anabaena sp. CA = ATCC 33047]|uniref:ATP-binding protein n=1 Tax=Anabaena sp. (strain CA / ATCC 33047) TaxID=52271 RepID=UPI00082C1F38|nr:ATP-binding protein [Anabaena sp. CA = ATCC 33047]